MAPHDVAQVQCVERLGMEMASSSAELMDFFAELDGDTPAP